MRQLVYPGDEIAEGRFRLGGGAYRSDEKIFSSVVGVLDKKENYVRVIPLAGKYMPKVNDFVIGKVTEQMYSNWDLEINSPYMSILPSRDFHREVDPFGNLLDVLPLGSYVYGFVREITHSKRIYVTMQERGARVLEGGHIIEVVPAKVPRIIGRKMSMINIIRRETGCTILVGQNGRVWINGKPEGVELAEMAIRHVEANAHTSGLTDNIKNIIIEARDSK